MIESTKVPKTSKKSQNDRNFDQKSFCGNSVSNVNKKSFTLPDWASIFRNSKKLNKFCLFLRNIYSFAKPHLVTLLFVIPKKEGCVTDIPVLHKGYIECKNFYVFSIITPTKYLHKAFWGKIIHSHLVTFGLKVSRKTFILKIGVIFPSLRRLLSADSHGKD